MKLKKSISILLCFVTLLSFTGCGFLSSKNTVDTVHKYDSVTDFYDEANEEWFKDNTLYDNEYFYSKSDYNTSIICNALYNDLKNGTFEKYPEDSGLNKLSKFYSQLTDLDDRESSHHLIQWLIDSVYFATSLEELIDLMNDETFSLFNPFIKISYYRSSKGNMIPFVGFDTLGDFDGEVMLTHYNILKKQYTKILQAHGFNYAKEMVDDAIELDKKLRKTIDQSTRPSEYTYFYLETTNNTLDIVDHLRKTGYLNENYYKNGDIAYACPSEYHKWINENLTEDNLKSIKAYYILNVIELTYMYDTVEIYDMYREIPKSIYGALSLADMPMEERAVVAIYYNDIDIYEAYYAQNNLEKYKLTDIEDLSNEIKAEYIKFISELDWLDKKQKARLKKKIKKVKIETGTQLPTNDLKDFEISEPAFASALSLMLSNRHFEQKAVKEGKLSSPNMNFLQTNAFYSPTENKIYILDGCIINPNYSKESSYEEKMAFIGNVISHELAHSIDSINIAYDYKDNYDYSYLNCSEHYNDFAKSVSELYSSYKTKFNNTINGEKCRDEIIADYIGMEIMLRILSKNINTNYDLFFETYAKEAAELYRSDYEFYSIKYFSHPPYRERINVTLSLFDKFYDTYNVDESSPYYIQKENRLSVY